jgi:hypothetical protein
VTDDFGKNGRAWRETDYETADLETVIQDLLTGQYQNLFRVIAFNTCERWSQDVSEDVARELERHVSQLDLTIGDGVSDFIEEQLGRKIGVQLPLPLQI